MKKLLFLLLITTVSYGQTYQNPTFGTVTTKTAPTSVTPPTMATVESSGVVGKIIPENIPMNVIPPTTHYTPTTPTLKGHFQGIDNAIGNIPLTTAGNTTRVWFTGDATTITAGTFYLTNATNKGTVANVSQSVINDDNQKKYFAQDLIGQPFATVTLFPPGVYAGNLSASTTPNSAQQRFTIELYKCNNAGTPIASGVAGAPVGDLGVTVILILDSGLLTLADGSVTNVPVSASLASQFSIGVGERIRYHVSAEKVGTASSNITESVWYGNSFNSFLDVPTPITSSGVSNVSTVTGASVTNALDNLKVADQAVAGAGVTYGHITDASQTIAGVKTLSNDLIANGFISGTVNKVLPIGNTSINQTLNLTGTNATSQLLNRSITNYNEDGIASTSSESAYRYVSVNNKSTNQTSRFQSTLLATANQNGAGSLGGLQGVQSLILGVGTGSVSFSGYYSGNNAPWAPTFNIGTFIGLDLNFMPNTTGGGVNSSRAILIGDVYGSTLARGIDIGVTSGTGKYNIYSQGTASNYFAGNVLIGTPTSNGNAFRLTGTAELITAPTTSAGTYDILTRNTVNGNVEKVASTAYATTASPTFTGTPTAPTATAGTNTTQIATTAFVTGNFVGLTGDQTKSGLLTVSDNTGSTVINGLSLSNSGTNATQGVINIANTSSGIAVRASTSSTGPAFVADGLSTSSAFLFAGRDNGANTFTVNRIGDVVARNITSNGSIRLKSYTVATLPASPTQGDMAYVTDATAPTYLGTLTGGGSVVCPVFYNGTAWVSH